MLSSGRVPTRCRSAGTRCATSVGQLPPTITPDRCDRCPRPAPTGENHQRRSSSGSRRPKRDVEIDSESSSVVEDEVPRLVVAPRIQTIHTHRYTARTMCSNCTAESHTSRSACGPVCSPSKASTPRPPPTTTSTPASSASRSFRGTDLALRNESRPPERLVLHSMSTEMIWGDGCLRVLAADDRVLTSHGDEAVTHIGQPRPQDDRRWSCP